MKRGARSSMLGLQSAFPINRICDLAVSVWLSVD